MNDLIGWIAGAAFLACTGGLALIGFTCLIGGDVETAKMISFSALLPFGVAMGFNLWLQDRRRLPKG